MLKFFRIPFASAGDKTAIPDATDPSGNVSYNQGYPLGYEQDPDTHPLTAKDVERDKTNQILFDVTTAIRELQAFGVPDFITPDLNGGSAFEYAKYSIVRWNNGVETCVYVSLVDSNSTNPSNTTNWMKVGYASGNATGTIHPYDGATLPSEGGYIWPDGKTVGNASSNATNRANADTYKYFVQVWNSYPDSIRPIYTSAGALTSRGVSADADWAANRAITVRDMKGFAPFGRDDLGGTPANRITNAGSGINGNILGASGGSQNVTLTTDQLPDHAHSTAGYTLANTGAGYQTSRFGAANETGTGSNFDLETSSVGGGQAHNNMPPTTIVNFILKL